MREGRLSRRMGLTRHFDPVKMEGALVRLIPKEDWTLVSHLLIVYGRKRSNARTAWRKSCAPNGAFEKSFAGQAKGYVSLPVHKEKRPESFALIVHFKSTNFPISYISLRLHDLDPQKIPLIVRSTGYS